MLILFAYSERSNQQKIFTNEIKAFQNVGYTLYNQDWVILAIQSGSTEQVKRVTKDFADPYTYGQNYYYQGKLVNGFGQMPENIDINTLQEGWQNQ